ncbi:MAG: hypothetical protein KDB00_28910 [Planctomycetales bacterium]|nr:hypothetical protein [Planctomycetales bacterium]
MRRFKTVLRGTPLALIMLLLGAGAPWVADLVAEEVQLGVAPSDPAKAGFTMFVMSERLGNEGFQPIKLQFRAIGKSIDRQRDLRILFRPRTQYATQIDFQFSMDVTVPQGVKTFEAPILVPHFYRWETCSVQIIEDGQRLGKVASQLSMPQSVKDWGQHMSIGIIVPRDAATSGAAWAGFPDVRSIVTVLGDGPITDKPEIKRLDDKQARTYVENLQSGWARFRIIDEDELQTSWIGYSQLDLILAPYPLLQRIEAEQPQRIEAVKQWVSTGGQIWAYAAPQNTTVASPADSQSPAQQSSPGDGPAGWLAGRQSDVKKAIQYVADPKHDMRLTEGNDHSPIQYQPWDYGSYYSNSYMYGNENATRQSVYDELVAANHPMVQTLKRNEIDGAISVMQYGMGRVVMISQEDPFPGSFQLWNSLEMERQRWSERNGVDYASGNDSYWAWLMSAVGQPPVTMFVILNGLFVLIMGPVLYFSLRRRARLYLLYFLAPALAFLVTMGLFGYAFVSDGFDNRARVRQLTWFDGRQPARANADVAEPSFPVVNQSRETYYTVVDNQRGLRFDNQSFVLPVLYSDLMNNYNYRLADDSRSGDYLIRQTEKDRVYSGEFLPTRTQVHYLVTRPHAGSLPIEFKIADGVAKLTNRNERTLKTVGVRDDQGKYWIGTNITPGSTVELSQAASNVFAGIAMMVVDPDSSDMPTPYQNRVSMNDRTGMEERFLNFSRNPDSGSFIALTEVDESEYALRECVQEDCVRLVGGLLP